MRGAAPSVVCPRCAHESPPSGAGRFMTCAKCGMSIDSNAGERQESVRGRVREKPEIEIDPTLPVRPSTFPLALAISIALFVTVGGAGIVAYIMMKPAKVTDEQTENLRAVESMQKAFAQLWDASLGAHDAPSCRMLAEIVRKPCRVTVKPSLLAFDEAFVAISTADKARTCVSAVEAFSRSRFAADCD